METRLRRVFPPDRAPAEALPPPLVPEGTHRDRRCSRRAVLTRTVSERSPSATHSRRPMSWAQIEAGGPYSAGVRMPRMQPPMLRHTYVATMLDAGVTPPRPWAVTANRGRRAKDQPLDHADDRTRRAECVVDVAGARGAVGTAGDPPLRSRKSGRRPRSRPRVLLLVHRTGCTS
jgi:hypothetical protein